MNFATYNELEARGGYLTKFLAGMSGPHTKNGPNRIGKYVTGPQNEGSNGSEIFKKGGQLDLRRWVI